MRIVFVHRNGAGQFHHLAQHLAGEGWQVTLLCETIEQPMAGVRVIRYPREAKRTAGLLPDMTMPEQHVRSGYRVAERLEALARREGPPDLVVGHPGWGGMLFAKDVLPDTPCLAYCEYFFRPEGGDIGFDPAEEVLAADRQRLTLRNMVQLTTLDRLDGGLSPTDWQRSRYPLALQPRIAVCHDGIDTERCRPDRWAQFRLPDGRVLKRGDPVVTFVARDLEPYRGFPSFMRAAALLAERNPDVTFVVAGGDSVSYGRHRDDGLTWRAAMMAETGLPPERIHFLGTIPYPSLIHLFQVSAAHVYLTYPFVLSWSVMEAMACGCVVIGSATPPVEEVLEDGRNGLLVDFWDEEAIAGRIEEVLAAPDDFVPLRRAARRIVAVRYGLAPCVERRKRLFETLVGRHRRAARQVADAPSAAPASRDRTETPAPLTW